MKKFLIMLLALVLFTGCSKDKTEEVVVVSGDEDDEVHYSVEPKNPWYEVEDLETVNSKAGSNLFKPESMEILDETFSYNDGILYKMGRYEFYAGGYEYTFSNAFTEDDISGVYSDSFSLFKERTDEDIEYYTGTEYKAARWFNDYGQFCIVCNDQSTMTDEDFQTIAEELKSESEIYHGVNKYDLLAGSYYESTYQRAFADIVSNGESVTIDIYWASSASELTRWTMTAIYEGENSLFYKNMQKSTITFNGDEDDEGTEVIVSNGGVGYFTIKEDGIYWDGSMDDTTKDCVFVLDIEE